MIPQVSLITSPVRTLLILRLLLWLGGVYLLEQPQSSLMGHHPRWGEELQAKCINTFLAAWGHWCPKLTTFFSNRPGVERWRILQKHASICCGAQCVVGAAARLWVAGLYKTLTREEREKMELRRQFFGFEKPVKKTDAGVTGASSLKETQLLSLSCCVAWF